MIPEGFKKMLSPVLGDEADEFFRALEESPAVRALRVNTLKISVEDFINHAPFGLSPIECVRGGYIFNEEKVGGEPLHHGGAFYVQDPSAMATVAAAGKYIKDGMFVLDLCAAPGGKSTQLAALCPAGFLVSNEFVSSRAKILRGNIERMGVRNSAVVSTSTEDIAKEFPALFDFVLCDAPCSGEGMMRKYNAEASENWSEENVHLCAERQREILANAAKCTADGGILLYSTCTFNLYENEMTVDSFLCDHEEFTLLPVRDEVAKFVAEGINFPGAHFDMTPCARFYPHKSEGEGQFIAIMKKCGEKTDRREDRKSSPLSSLTREEERIAEEFFVDAFGGVPMGYSLKKLRNTVMLCPGNSLCPKGAVLCGTAAGEVIKGRFQPHHHLFSAFGGEMKRRVSFSSKSEEIRKYLRGETVDAPCENGWCAVLCNGVPVGGGKAVNGTVKNHYPKGLRLRT